jgi:hypothetical protein
MVTISRKGAQRIVFLVCLEKYKSLTDKVHVINVQTTQRAKNQTQQYVMFVEKVKNLNRAVRDVQNVMQEKQGHHANRVQRDSTVTLPCLPRYV